MSTRPAYYLSGEAVAQLLREAMSAPFLEVLKASLAGALHSLIWWEVSLPTAEG